jgi:hypothetical protein
MSAASDSGVHAFLWNETFGFADLNTLIPPESGWRLEQADAINDAGHIVGHGLFNGEVRGFLLTPIPEPTSLVLGLIGAVFLIVVARAFKRGRNEYPRRSV